MIILENKEIRKIHFGGIGGCGISALAQIALKQGYQVSGSDLHPSEYTQKLQKLGIPIVFNHQPKNVQGADLCVNTAAFEENNPEILEARKLGIPILKHAQFLGLLMREKYGICISGTHGKTTTDALIGLTLAEMGLDPTVEVGGTVPEFKGNVRIGKGKYFVAEACEFDHSFLNLYPKIAVILNIEEDHPDYYQSQEDLAQAFLDFINLVPSDGFIVAGIDSSLVKKVLEKRETQAQVVTFGKSKKADWRALRIKSLPGCKTEFQAHFKDEKKGKFILGTPGEQNVQNALAVLAVVNTLHVNLKYAQRVFERFTGVKRRFEIVKRENDVTVVSDYAHHPSQIKATIAAARACKFKKIITIFQPHTYSRTKHLFQEFTHAFDQSDFLLVTKTYIPEGRHEEVLEEYSSQSLVELIKKRKSSRRRKLSGENVYYLESLGKIERTIRDQAKKGTCVLVLGAGDIYKIAKKVI